MHDEMYHWGVKGMRWGVRRYQRKDGSLTAAGKRRLKKELKKQAKETKETETVEQKKARILSSRSAKELYDNADLFTTAELNNAYNRLNLERNIKNLAPEEVSKGQAFANKASKALETTKNLVDKGTAAYDSIQKVAKLFGKDVPEIPDWASKDVKKLTDDQLEKAVNRLKKEKMFDAYVKERKKPDRTVTKNLIGNIEDLTDEQVKDMINRLRDEETLKSKLAGR